MSVKNFSAIYIFLAHWFLEETTQNDYFLSNKDGEKKVYCVTNSTFALSWIQIPRYSVSPEAIRSTFIPPINNSFNNEIEETDPNTMSFIKRPWKLTNSFQSDFNKIVLDERWEEMDAKMTKETVSDSYYGTKLLYTPLLEISKSDFEIPLSIRTKHEAHIFLCDGEDPPSSNCYWLMLQAWDGNETAIRKCSQNFIPRKKDVYAKPPCKEKKFSLQHPVQFPSYLFEDKWTHFKLKKEKGTIVFTKISGHETKDIFKWEDNEENFITVRHLIVHSKHVQGLWKVHKVTYLYTNEESSNISLGPNIKLNNNALCLSMYISMCITCKIKLTFQDRQSDEYLDSKTFSSNNSEWFQIKYLNKKINFNYGIQLLVSTIGSDIDSYWAIDKIRFCQENEFRIIGLSEKQPCQLMSSENTISVDKKLFDSDSTCPEDTIGKFCVPCEWIYPECKQIQICTENKCACSAGYNRNLQYSRCANKCEAKMFGHGCKQNCQNCYHGCNNVNGVCDSQPCINNFVGPKCDKKPLSALLEVTNVSYTNAIVIVTNFTSIRMPDSYNEQSSKDPDTYFIQYKEAADRYNNWLSDNSSIPFGKTKSIQIVNLQADKKYFVRAIVTYKDGTLSSDFVKITEFTTRCLDISVNQIKIKPSNTSAIVLFELRKNTCKLKKYAITVSEKQGTFMNNTTVHFYHLTPFTNYKLTVDGGLMLLEKEFHTTEGVPEQVEDLIVTNISDSFIKLKWSKPKSINGGFQHYTIEYQRFASLSCNYMSSNQKFKSKLTTETTFAKIENLTPYSNYSISIFAVNSKFQGFSEVIFVATTALNRIENYEVPTIHNITTSHVAANIKFSEIHCDKMRGPLFSLVNYTCTKAWCSNSSRYLNNFKNSVELKDLQPFMNYKLQITFYRNVSGHYDETKYSEQFKTKPTIPFKVRELLVYSKNKSSVSLRWKPPYPPTGVLEECRINVNWNKHSYRTLYLTQCKLWPDFYCGYVENLIPHQTYTFGVQCRNNKPEDFGDSQIINNIQTKTEKSRAPYDLKIEWTPKNDLELEWKHPNETNGEIQYFRIRLYSVQKTIEKNMTISNYNLTYYFKIRSEEIEPTTTYRLQIAACNNFIGDLVTTNVNSPPDIPKLYNIPQTYSTNETITVNILPEKPKGTSDSYRVMLLIWDKSNIGQMLDNFKLFGLEHFRLVSDCDLNRAPDSTFVVTIGNEQQRTNCKQMDNPALQPGTFYKIAIVLVNYFNSINRTNVYLLNLKTEGDPLYSETNLNLLALLVLLLIIPLAAILYVKRQKIISYKNNLFYRENTSTEILDVKEEKIPLSSTKQEDVATSVRRKNTKAQMRNPDSNKQAKIHSKLVKIIDFEIYVKESIQNGELDRQHNLFPRGQTKAWSYGSLKENKSKNRYNNLIAYDHSRVILQKTNNDPYSDYINASYIDGHKVSKAYIATQGPKAVTLNDFWRMIWENNVKHIANLANIYEGGKKKVEKYWPDINETLQFGSISVQHVSSQVFADFEHRIFSVSKNNETRKIDQLHFMSWPDHGVPLYSQSLVPFLQKLLQFPLNTNSPIVVHCSAGVGRTGTVLLCDICLRMAAREGTIDVLKNLHHLREQRANMVDNIEQYKLAHLVILECLVGMHTGIPCNEIEESVNKILTNGAVTIQMKYLKDTQWQDQAMKTVGQTDEEMLIVPEKNRFEDIIPEIQGRVFISRYPTDDETSSYINAVKVDGFRCPGRFIVTQQPLPNTLGDFWRLVEENNIGVILSLNEVNVKDKTSCNFWPTRSNPEMVPVPHITLKHVNTVSSDSYYIVTVQLHIKSREEHMSIQILAIKNWSFKQNCPDKIGNFLTFWEEADALTRRFNPVLVTCYDGVKASGLYVALCFVIEKMKLEQICDVCQAVRSIRHNREQFVQDQNQFEFLYKAALLYINRFEPYANFN